MDKPDKETPLPEWTEIDRRIFLKVTGGAAIASAGLAGVLESGRAPSWAQVKKLHLLHWVDFVPAGDEELTRQTLEAGKTLGAQITLERINATELQARITASIESGSGPDIIQMLHNWTHAYQTGCTDVGELAEWKQGQQGDYYALSQKASVVGGKWLSLPYGIVGNAVVYRTDLFKEVGGAVPKNWDENRALGKKLKARGTPFGQTLGHTVNDAPSFTYPYLWTWGAKEVEDDGKTVAINSKETVESVKFMVAMWKDAYDEGGLAWDDTNNNRAYLSGTISACLNGASIYIAAKRGPEKFMNDEGTPLYKVSSHFPLPGGPAGQFSYHVPFAHAVMRYSKNQGLAHEFLKGLHSKAQFAKWFVAESGYSVGSNALWGEHPMWDTLDPALQLYRSATSFVRGPGYAGGSTAKAAQASSNGVITEMYARAVRGVEPHDAVGWAENELNNIYA